RTHRAQSFLGCLQIGRIEIDADQAPLLTDTPQEFACVAGEAKRAVDSDLTRTRREYRQYFVQEHGPVLARRCTTSALVHGNSCPTSPGLLQHHRHSLPMSHR